MLESLREIPRMKVDEETLCLVLPALVAAPASSPVASMDQWTWNGTLARGARDVGPHPIPVYPVTYT